jgi:hypothetical protein
LCAEFLALELRRVIRLDLPAIEFETKFHLTGRVTSSRAFCRRSWSGRFNDPPIQDKPELDLDRGGQLEGSKPFNDKAFTAG